VPKSYLDQDRAASTSILPSDPLVGLAVYTQWDGSGTKVTHALTGQDHRITDQIDYRSAKTS